MRTSKATSPLGAHLGLIGGLPTRRWVQQMREAGGRETPIEVNERDLCEFTLRHIEDGLSYELRIGDEVIQETPAPYGRVEWKPDHQTREDLCFFESCAEIVFVRLFSLGSQSEGRHLRAELPVWVNPDKLGDRYFGLRRDIRRATASLLFELVSRNTRALTFGATGRAVVTGTANVEYFQLRKLWTSLAPHLESIRSNPQAYITSALAPRVTLTLDRVGSDTLAALISEGINPHRWPGGALRVRGRRRHETHDIPEHRILKGFIELLEEKSAFCRKRAQRQLHEVRRELDRPVPLDKRNGYQVVRNREIRRLEYVIRDLTRIGMKIAELKRAPFLESVRPVHEFVLTPVFQSVPSYYEAFQLALGYIRASYWTLGDGTEAAVKKTSRLFEIWVFLQTIQALQTLGCKPSFATGLARQITPTSFVLDLQRDTTVEFLLRDNWRLRARFEPDIHSPSLARERGEYLATAGAALRSPDVLIEFFSGYDGDGLPVIEYAVVIDAKYSLGLSNTRQEQKVMERLEKYYLIQRTGRPGYPVVRQVWAAWPGRSTVEPNDHSKAMWNQPATGDQLAIPLGGKLGLQPPEIPIEREDSDLEEEITPSPAMLEFMTGLLTYLGGSLLRQSEGNRRRVRFKTDSTRLRFGCSWFMTRLRRPPDDDN